MKVNTLCSLRLTHVLYIKGGLTLLSSEKCPWKINYAKTESYFYDRLEPNLWTARGNGWKSDNSIRIRCYGGQDTDFESYECGCDAFNVTGVPEQHKHLEGVYEKLQHSESREFVAPVFKMKGGFYLYSHHHEGRFWLIGSSLTTWSLRLRLLGGVNENDDSNGLLCPDSVIEGWRFLAKRDGEKETWLKADEMRVECAEFNNDTL